MAKMHPVPHSPEHDAAIFESALVRLVRLETIGVHRLDKPRGQRHGLSLDHLSPPDESPDVAALEIRLGQLVDRLLLSEGIRRVDAASRGLLLRAFWLALRDALEARLRNSQGDYTPDAKAERFPAWVSPISGHAFEGRTVADGYHGVELEDQAAALAKYPRYEVS